VVGRLGRLHASEEGRYPQEEMEVGMFIRIPREALPPRQERRRRQKGAETLAGALAFIVLLPFLVVTIDVAWGLFVKVTLQHACREAVRFAITSQTSANPDGGNFGHVDSIKGVALRYAGPVLQGQEDKLTVRFYNPNTLVEDVGGSRNRGGNVVMVSVEGYAYQPIVTIGKMDGWSPLEIKANDPIMITVHAADRLESCPMGVCAPI
jgi:hypothetical protein